MVSWTIVENPGLPSGIKNWPAWNMALDAWMAQQNGENEFVPRVRLYQWSHAAITVGRFQNVEQTLDLHACAEFGIEVGRRLTGGRGILHGEDLTLSIAANTAEFGVEEVESVVQTYHKMTRFLLAAFAALDIPAVHGKCAPPLKDRRGDCFASISQADIIGRNGIKLIGAALYRKGSRALLQCSIPLKVSEGRATLSRRIFRSGNTSASEAAQWRIDGDRLHDAIIDSLCETFGSEPGVETLTARDAVTVKGTMGSHVIEHPE